MTALTLVFLGMNLSLLIVNAATGSKAVAALNGVAVVFLAASLMLVD